MMGPDIFSNPLVGGFTLLIVIVVFILFIVRLMPYIFATKHTTLKALNLLKMVVIFLPLFFAIGSLLNYVGFDLIGWINFEIIVLPTLYFLELLTKLKGWLK